MTNFYSCSPVCTPSRAGLLTGRYPRRAYAGDHVYFPEGSSIANFRKLMGNKNEIPRDEIMLSEVLQANGYATALIGKWHLGDREGHLPNDFGFDYYYGVRYSNDMLPLHIYKNEEIIDRDEKKLNSGFAGAYTDSDMPIEGKAVDQSLLTENYTREAINFIQKNQDKPFLLYLPHSFPHVPHFSSARQEGKSKAGLYGDVVEDLDWSTGQIMDALRSMGLEENTLVLITSDNGGDVNGSAGNLRGRKQQTYEGGQRVPMVIYGPGLVKATGPSDELSTNLDILPTLLDLLKISPPEDRIIDGKSILPVILNNGSSPHEYVFYNAAANGKFTGVRDSLYKYHEGATGTFMNMFGAFGLAQPMKAQLTNVKLDNEAHNLIKKYPEKAQQLKVEMEKMQEQLEQNRRGWY